MEIDQLILVKENINMNGALPKTLSTIQMMKIAKCFREYHLSRIKYWLYVDDFIGENQVENK